MKYKIVCVRDRAADVFGQPSFVAALGVAVRAFGDQIKSGDKDNPICSHPEDFDLYHVGEYDDANATFSGDGPVQIAVGKDYKL